MAVAFKLQDGVNDVFQHLRSGDAAVFGDVADEDDWHTTLFGILQDGRGTFPNLRNRTWRGVDGFAGDGLYGVDDEKIGLDIFQMHKDAFQARVAKQETFRRCLREAIGTELDLAFTLLAAHIEQFSAWHIENGLQEKR